MNAAAASSVLVHALVDRADGVVQLEIARRQADGRLRFGHGLVQPAPRRKGPRHAVVAAREVGSGFQRQAILIFRLLEEAGRPESIAEQGGRLGIGRRELDELQRFGTRDVEFGHAQRRLHDAGSRGAPVRRDGGGQRPLKGLERILVTSIRQELATELKLNLARLGLRRDVSVDGQGRGQEEACDRRRTDTASHGSSRQDNTDSDAPDQTRQDRR